MAIKKGLGKGLDSLITDKVNTKSAASKNNPKPKSEHAADAIMMNITKVEPNREQPRKKFDEDALLELAESIKQYGVLQPLLVQERLNPNLQMEGVVFTMYDVRTKLSNQVVENVKENLDTKIYETMIPRNIRLAEAPSYGIPINMYDSKSAGAESYRKLAKEIVDRKDL